MSAMGNMLDVFKGDAFNTVAMTDAIINTPQYPGEITEAGYFFNQPINVLTSSIEIKGTTVNMVPIQPRNAPGMVVVDPKARLVPIQLVHLPQRGAVTADQVQGIRAFGQTDVLKSVWDVVKSELENMRTNIDITIEYQRIGAIMGQLRDADGSVFLDLFDLLGVTQQVFAMDLDDAMTDVLEKIRLMRRLITDDLGRSAVIKGVTIWASRTFYDAFVSHANVVKYYLNWMGATTISGGVGTSFSFGGITIREYQGKLGDDFFIPEGTAFAVPEGVPKLFKTLYGPANYIETVNTMGLPYYAKQELMDFDKGVQIESQSNTISYCTRPRSIIKLTIS